MKTNIKSGIELIAQEREEQITKHGISVASDVENNDFSQLKSAAIMLLGGFPHQDEENATPFNWDPKKWEYMTSKSKIDKLVIAGAFIAAEIDRLQVLYKYEEQ